MTTLYEIADGKVRLNLHKGQARAWDSDKRIVAMIAGSQGGKTSFGPWWLWREIYQKRGGGDYMAATSSFDLFKLKMLPEIRNVFEHVLGVGRYWSGDKILELRDPDTGLFRANRADDPMWGRIILRSAQAAGGLESATAKGAWLDEAGQDEFSLTAFEAVRRRLTLHRGRILITTTPYNLGWLKQLIVDRAGADIDLIQFESIANPNFSHDEYEALRAELPTWKFRMFHQGQFDRPPGQIYSDFIDNDREHGGHKVAPFPLPRAWLRYVGVDPGVIHTCKVWLAQDPDQFVYYLYRESLGERKGADEHAQEAIRDAQAEGAYVAKYAVGAKSEIYHREDWATAGAGTVLGPEHNDVEAGIDRVISLWRQRRLFVFDTCTGTLDQLATYRRKVDDLGNVQREIVDKETYHYLDALRYIAEHLDFYDTAFGSVTYAADAGFGASPY